MTCTQINNRKCPSRCTVVALPWNIQDVEKFDDVLTSWLHASGRTGLNRGIGVQKKISRNICFCKDSDPVFFAPLLSKFLILAEISIFFIS